MLLISLDFWLVGGYVMFCTELICPKRFPMWKLLIIPSPFVIYTLIFLFTSWQTIYWLDIFTSVIMVSVFYIFLELAVKRYTRMLEENISDLENFDLSWIVSVLRLMLIFAIFWVVESFAQKTYFVHKEAELNFIIDILYCIFCSLVVLLVTRKLIYQKIYLPKAETADLLSENDFRQNRTAYHVNKITQNIDSIIKEKEYFLDKQLTLDSLVTQIGTNRQYISNYINKEKHSTFYDYINAFRLQRAVELLEGLKTGNEDLKTTNNLSIDEISQMAGFSNYSTFFRAFKKKYNMSPSKYIQRLQITEKVFDERK